MSDDVCLAAIWAQDRRGVIGTGTRMLWRVPADLAFFKSTTHGSPIVMGRSSWEALGGALPGRTNIVMTSRADYVAEGATVAHSLEDALNLARQAARATGASTVWITGGAQVYAATIDRVHRLVVTELDLTTDTPSPVVHAPMIDQALWELDSDASDTAWRPQSGDARWRVHVYRRRKDG